MALFIPTIFLAAFLVFQIQPVIAKVILPWFGGASSVWSLCMVFFQAGLLGGYAYAHVLHERLTLRAQAVVHTLLLAASLALLPVAPRAPAVAAAGAHPTWEVLRLLVVSVGLPYFLLASTSPLVQSWYSKTHPGRVPYRLFALSNLASLLALLAYPVVVEPNTTTRTQQLAWSAAYGCFAVLSAASAWYGVRFGTRTANPGESPGEEAAPPGWGVRLLWLALPACGSILLLAVTSFLTEDVAAIPFLWIVPLSAYLLTFVISFEAPGLYYRPVFLPLLIAALALTAHLLWSEREGFGVLSGIAATVGALFVFCMVCHGELVRLRPHPRHLTAFYLMLSAGGAAGGLFVGLLAPVLFHGYYEFHLGLALCALLAVLVMIRSYPVFFRSRPGRLAGAALLAGVAGFAVYLGAEIRDSNQWYRLLARNFYCQLRVRDMDEQDGAGMRRKLVHGTINHGEQFLSAEHRTKPVSYFCPETGIGRLLSSAQPGRPRRVGILGLGCGTLLAYGRAGDTFRIYEINPLVLQLARSEFTYLKDTQAQVEVVMGDGRLSLESEPPQQFDVLVMDAFSGDSVPVHLITREAFATYFRHLKPGGVVAVNIANKYLDLAPVIERAAASFGKLAWVSRYEEDEENPLCFGVTWALVMDRSAKEALGAGLAAGEELKPRPGFRAWSDDYSSMHRILK